MKDHPAVLKYAYSFSTTSGMDLDDLLQEARIARWNAEQGVLGNVEYDPRKSSFNTFATYCVYRHLCGITDRHKRVHPITHELDEGMPDRSMPAPDRNLLLTELIRDLPEDARVMVDLVLNDVAAMDLTAHKARAYFRKRLGLSQGRVNVAFSAVTEMLMSMAV